MRCLALKADERGGRIPSSLQVAVFVDLLHVYHIVDQCTNLPKSPCCAPPHTSAPPPPLPLSFQSRLSDSSMYHIVCKYVPHPPPLYHKVCVHLPLRLRVCATPPLPVHFVNTDHVIPFPMHLHQFLWVFVRAPLSVRPYHILCARCMRLREPAYRRMLITFDAGLDTPASFQGVLRGGVGRTTVNTGTSTCP